MRIIKHWIHDVLDAAYGVPVFDEEVLEEDVLLIELNDFPGDEYMLEWQVTAVTMRRLAGPKWAQKSRLVGFYANWLSKEGIPIQNNEYSGLDQTRYAGTFELEDPIDWRYACCESVVKHMQAERIANGYVPPIIDMREPVVTDKSIQEFIEKPQDDPIIEGGEMTFEVPIEKEDS